MTGATILESRQLTQNFNMKLKKDFSVALQQIRHDLAADFAIISQLRDREYTVLEIASDFGAIFHGQKFATDNNFCNDVVNSGEMVRFAHVGSVHETALHPVYGAMQLEAYLGIPLQHGSEVVGTLNFSFYDPRQPDFKEEDIDKAWALAREIEEAIVA